VGTICCAAVAAVNLQRYWTRIFNCVGETGVSPVPLPPSPTAALRLEGSPEANLTALDVALAGATQQLGEKLDRDVWRGVVAFGIAAWIGPATQ
jgi:hypothetical protein